MSLFRRIDTAVIWPSVRSTYALEKNFFFALLNGISVFFLFPSGLILTFLLSLHAAEIQIIFPSYIHVL